MRPLDSSSSASLLTALSAAVPLALLWDFCWESSIGIDLPWSPPHTALFVVIVLAGLVALVMSRGAVARRRLSLSVILWGTAAFLTAWLFDRWWQSAYGLAAGIWGPPQLLKATAFFAVAIGVWLLGANAMAAGSVLALISVVSLPFLYANRQHSGAFFEIAAGTYPIVLAAQAVMGRGRFPATMAALCYLLMWGAMVWLLPVFPAEPLVAPIVNPLDHLLPPPFPLLLIAPALVFDLLWRVFPARRLTRGSAVEAALAFLLVFVVVQWSFSVFLLSLGAEGRFFAGGGQHWPFFLHIAPSARTQFWPDDPLNLRSTAVSLLLAIIASALGLRIGLWRKEEAP